VPSLKEFVDLVFHQRTARKVALDERATAIRERRLATVVNPNRAVIEEIHRLERRAAGE